MVAFQGAPGSFSDEAVSRIWAGEATAVPMRDFASVTRAVVEGDVHFAVLPVENSSIGPITESCEAIAAAHVVRSVGELTLDVRHCLIGQPGSHLRTLRRVFSHPAALAQCRRFFASNPWIQQVDAYDTAGAAADVALRADSSEAAIAPRGAAKRYELSLLATDIQDDATNTTRFVVIASDCAGEYSSHWKPAQFFTSSDASSADGQTHAR